MPTACARTSRARAHQGEVGAQRVERGAVLLDEHARGGAARQGLDAQRAGAREQVDDAQPLEAAQPARQHREQRLSCAIGGGAGGVADGGLERAASPLAGDDPHPRSPAKAGVQAPPLRNTSRPPCAPGLGPLLRGGTRKARLTADSAGRRRGRSAAPRRSRPGPDRRARTRRTTCGSVARPAAPDIRARGGPRGSCPR